MSVLVWDARTLASDCQMNLEYTKYKVSKIEKYGSELLGAVGTSGMCKQVKEWYKSGASYKDWPGNENNYADLLVVKKTFLAIGEYKNIVLYYNGPTPIEILSKYFALGVGKDYALGALEMGADAIKAVEVACKYSNACGMGIDALTLD